MNEATTKQWTSKAGPRQTQKVHGALKALRWKGKSFVEITGIVGGDEGRTVLTNLFGPAPGDEACQAAQERIGNQFDYEITKENHKAVIEAIEKETAKLELFEVDKRETPQERTERDQKLERLHKEHEKKAEKKSADTAKIVATLQEQYPWAKAHDGKMSEHSRASYNIKQELRKAFPGIKFSVRSDSFSMGNSVDVSWDLGPTTKDVDSILGKYSDGSFDGMTDMYNYDHSAEGDAVSVVLGRAKYVHSHRSIPHELYLQVGQWLCKAQDVKHEGQYTRYLYGQGDTEDLQQHVYGLFQKSTFPAGAEIIGIYRDSENNCFAFSLLDSPKVETVENTFCTVQKHFHTKKQFDFWMVVLAEKVERASFVVLRTRCKDAGGWYSRQWGKTPGGFAFESEQAANSFAETIS